MSAVTSWSVWETYKCSGGKIWALQPPLTISGPLYFTTTESNVLVRLSDLSMATVTTTFSLYSDLQAAAGPVHRQRRRTHAATGGAGRPAPRPLQTHLQTLLPGSASLSAGLPQKPGRHLQVWTSTGTAGAGGKMCKLIKLKGHLMRSFLCSKQLS